MHFVAISRPKCLKDFELDYHYVIFCGVVPAQRIDEMHELLDAFQRLVFYHIDNALEDLLKLLLNPSLCFISTAFKTGQIMLNLHAIVSQRALEPLHQIEEATGTVTQIHGKV